ncbi:unnamed protein product [Urochloa decumbens]|uniref:Uncharacterized protein n=1 Tax=Urochloa decumbens TaxID=240449 RepID=A0ABC8ZC88_9POAL
MSRHRRQPSRALPLDFIVDDGEGPPAGSMKGGATSLDGSQHTGAGTGGARGDAGKGQEGHSNKAPPAATGSRSSVEGAAGNKSRDDGTGAR